MTSAARVVRRPASVSQFLIFFFPRRFRPYVCARTVYTQPIIYAKQVQQRVAGIMSSSTFEFSQFNTQQRKKTRTRQMHILSHSCSLQ